MKKNQRYEIPKCPNCGRPWPKRVGLDPACLDCHAEYKAKREKFARMEDLCRQFGDCLEQIARATFLDMSIEEINKWEELANKYWEKLVELSPKKPKEKD